KVAGCGLRFPQAQPYPKKRNRNPWKNATLQPATLQLSRYAFQSSTRRKYRPKTYELPEGVMSDYTGVFKQAEG
ncbi:MAG: hypothetical protein IJ427_00890, partial [Lachnospiraceae bacterium]|nr:hypothetical protein [Lachnospiraceae bacterium]